MTLFDAQVTPLAQIDRVLPKLLSNLSLARAQIAMDQLRGAVASRQLGRIVFLTVTQEGSETPLAAAIAIQTGGADNSDSDMATVVHAGILVDGVTGLAELIQPISRKLETEMLARDVRFLQWATDSLAAGDAGEMTSQWCRGLGFAKIGTLDYLSGPVPAESEPLEPAGPRKVTLDPVDCRNDQELEEFARLVERTYQQTLDCPSLAQHRTALQTLRGYQLSAAFDPTLWFYAREGDALAGCVVLANHRASDSAGSPVVEIVYMGLLPEARGRGLGSRLVSATFQIARKVGADQLILAVDQGNVPARHIYDAVGLKPILTETVWVKSL